MPNTTSTRTRRTAKKTSPAKRVTKAVKKAPATKRVRKTVARVRTAEKRVAKTARRSVTSAKRVPAKSAKSVKSARTARTGRTARTARSARSIDAITLLKQDHREAQDLFRRFERAGDGARRTKGQLVDRMIEALSRHAGIEELVFYPAVRREVPAEKSDVLEAIEEHHVVKLLLHEIERLDPSDERFDAKVTVMIENVRHHVREEEDELFPRVRKALTRSQLLEIGDALQAAKSRVPTRPHPYAPDEPPGNVLVGGAAAVIDRARSVGKKAVERVRDEIPTR
jgi:hemerythrin-like domain-containing protein